MLLHPNTYCRTCFNKIETGDLPRSQSAVIRKYLEKNMQFPMLYYLHNLNQTTLPPSMSTPVPQPAPQGHFRGDDFDTVMPPAGFTEPGSESPQNRPQFDPYGRPIGTRPLVYNRSTVAFVLMLLGLFLPIVPGFLMEVLAFGLALRAFKTEAPNWRSKLAIIGSLFILIILGLGLILIQMYPEQFVI